MECEPGTSAETVSFSRLRQGFGGSGMTRQHAHRACLHNNNEDHERVHAHTSPEMHEHTATALTTSQHPSPHLMSAALPSPPDSPASPARSESILDSENDSLSLSSFPSGSVGSSFFFSSGAASPHHHPAVHLRRRAHDANSSAQDTESASEGMDPRHALIIPSLTLPAPVPQPTAHGQTLGDVSLLVVGPSSVYNGVLNANASGETTSLAKTLVEFLADADDVVDICDWEDFDGPEGDEDGCSDCKDESESSDRGNAKRKARILHASTDWLEERDPHGLERFEGAKNISFVELESFGPSESTDDITRGIEQHILDVFHDTSTQLRGIAKSSPLLHALLASGNSALYTSLVYITSSPPTPQDSEIISSLSRLLPVIPLSSTSVAHLCAYTHRGRHVHMHFDPPIFSVPSSSQSRSHSRERKASNAKSRNKMGVLENSSPYLPHTPSALRASLFRAPHTLASLRSESAMRYLKWWEVQRVLEGGDDPTFSMGPDLRSVLGAAGSTRQRVVGKPIWNKEEWETELSVDYAKRLREIRLRSPATYPSSALSGNSDRMEPGVEPALDPLRLPSIVLLSLSLLAPRQRALDFRRSSIIPASPSITPRHSEKASLEFESGSTPDIEDVQRKGDEKNTTSDARKKSSSLWSAFRWGIVLVGAFCAGIGIGMTLSG